MKFGKVWVSLKPDKKEDNRGGYYCEVFSDGNFKIKITKFKIKQTDCNCKSWPEVNSYITQYVARFN